MKTKPQLPQSIKMQLALLILLVWVALVALPTHAQEPRLAVVAADLAHQTAADLLTSELTRQTNLILLERVQISKVLGELATSAMSGMDFLKLGQLVGADGLLVLVAERQGTNNVLTARLLAVKPGVILQEHSYPWPLKNSVEWSSHVAKQFEPLFPKLTVLTKDAIPISVVGLRSALHSAESQESENQLTQLLIARLVKEPEIFILERQHLREATSEKELKPPAEESPFWTGSYLLEGTLDKDGFDPDKMTLNARLVPPQNGPPVSMDLSGPRKDLPALVEALAGKILAALQRAPVVKNWQPLSEADKYYAESQWTLRWSLAREAQAAGESSLALGNHGREVIDLLINAYIHDPALDPLQGVYGAIVRLPYDNHSQSLAQAAVRQATSGSLDAIERASELFNQNTRTLNTNGAPPDRAWLALGLELLGRSGGLLQAFYYDPDARQGRERQLAEVRSLTREIAHVIESNALSSTLRIHGNLSLNALKWADGGYWFDRPEDALRMDRELFEQGWFSQNPPWVIGWTIGDDKRVPGLQQIWASNLASSTNSGLKLKGLCLALAVSQVNQSPNFETIESAILSAFWEQRQKIFQIENPNESVRVPITEGSVWLKNGLSPYNCVEVISRKKFNTAKIPTPIPDALLSDFETRVRRDFFQNPSAYPKAAFEQLFPPFIQLYNPTDAKEFLPLVIAFVQKPGFPSEIRYSYNDLIQKFAEQQGRATVESIPAKTPVPASSPSTRVAPPTTNADYTVIHFTPLDLGDPFPGLRPIFNAGIYRQRRLWFQIHYLYNPPENTNYIVDPKKAAYAGVNPETGVAEVIPFPQDQGFPDPQLHGETAYRICFEVTEDSLYVSARDHLERYRFPEKRWETIPVPMELGATVTAVNDRLYLNTRDSILELEPNSQKIKTLASARRRRPLNALDDLGPYTAVYPGPGNGIGVVALKTGGIYIPDTGTIRHDYGRASSEIYFFTPADSKWEKSQLSLTDLNPYVYHFKGKAPGTIAWSRIRYEKNGRLVDPTPSERPKEFTFVRAPGEISFRCDVPYGKVLADPLYPGYWMIPDATLQAAASAKP